MMTNTSSPSARAALTGNTPILLGIAIYVVGRPYDGFLGEFLDGATIALMVLGAYLVGRALWDRGDGDRGWWLPRREDAAAPESETTSDGDDR